MIVSINGQNKNIWSGYIPPEEDELFSSWFLRLSAEHKIKSHSFSKLFLENQPIWNRDIDRMYPKTIIKNLIDHTPLNEEQIYQLFLISYEGRMYEQYGINKHLLGILDIGIYHRKRTHFGLVYCPGCLQNSSVYYRKKWRLSTSVCCTKCKLMLLDRCHNCSQPIAFHRLESGKKNSILNLPLYLCWNCKTDLRQFKFEYENNSIVEKYQLFIDNTINKGYNNLTQYSFEYFKLLFYLRNTLITNSKKWNRIKIAYGNKYQLEKLKETRIFSLLPYSIPLITSFRILNENPKNFVEFCRQKKLRYSDFTKDLNPVPFWFDHIFKTNT